jgi:hypothetical protein
MKPRSHLAVASLLAVLASACSDGSDDGAAVTPPPSVGAVTVSADITQDTTWTANNVYTLSKHVFVRSGTLTIEPGTKILGLFGTSLVVTQNGKIHAVGTPQAPIVFTSGQPDAYREPGNWGGVVLLGKAPINVTGGTNSIEGFPAGTTGTEYGGNDAGHDCGALQYVRIEFAGYQLAVDNELNGLTVGGCGSATLLDYIQVHKGADDGVEFFGGTANLRHAVITQSDDDGLDWDYGWTGKVQFLVVQQNASVGDRGIEADNNGNAHDALPRSHPTIYNLTLVGSNAEPGTAGKNQGGMHLRRGTAGEIHNAIVTGFTDRVVDVDGTATVAQWDAGDLQVADSIFWDNANIVDATTGWPEPSDNDAGFDERAEFFAAGLGNEAIDPGLAAAFDLAAPSFLPSTVRTGATPPADGFFDVSATHVGAFGTTDWMQGWTAFPKQRNEI